MNDLSICQEEIGFEMIHGHGLLSDIPARISRGRCRGRKACRTWICRIIDNRLSLEIEPLIELGFMPGELGSGPHTVFWWKSNVTPPQ